MFDAYDEDIFDSVIYLYDRSEKLATQKMIF